MPFLMVMVLLAGDNSGMRIMLLLIVLIAAILILAGGAIAVFTFINQRKGHVASSDTILSK